MLELKNIDLRSDALITGSTGDWLLQYAPGDYGVVKRVRFESVYMRQDVSR